MYNCQVDNRKLKNYNLRKDFIAEETNNQFLKTYIEHPSSKNENMLNEQFKEFVYERKLVSFLSKTIHYEAIQFDKREKRFLERNQPLLDNENVNYSLPDTDLQEQRFKEHNHYTFQHSKQSDFLSESWAKLTDKQQLILDMNYIYGYKDQEIGQLLNQSQQSISRIKQRALDRLRNIYKERNDKGEFY